MSADRDEEEEYTNWIEKAEASSRDGDDEDDEEEVMLSPKSSARRRAAKAKGNSYRHQGVQTDPKVTYSRGVQVPPLSASKRPVERSAASHRSLEVGNEYSEEIEDEIERQAYGTTRQAKPLSPTLEEQVANLSFRPSATLRGVEERAKADSEIGSPTTPVLRKRGSSEDSITESSIISSPTKEVEEVGTPRVSIRIPEPTEGSHVTSMIPGSGHVGGRRVGGRVFSPTTGVDIFKRGSEEVLARFLMQAPSGWSGGRDTVPGPPTPSATY